MMTSSSPERRDANEQQVGTAYHHQQHHQQQQQQRRRRSSTISVAHSITSVFSHEAANQVDSIELKRYTQNPLPQIRDHHDHDDDDGLQTRQATPDSCSREDGNTNTGVTTPDLQGFPERVSRASFSASSVGTSASSLARVHSRFSVFWGNNISVVVPSKDARDHLALERTYLSYHRTSLILAILATIVSQLTVINHAPSPSQSFGFYVLGKPLAVVLASCAVISSIVGGLRWWRLQQGLLRGVGISGGAEILIVAGIVGAIIATTFGLVLAIDITKEHS